MGFSATHTVVGGGAPTWAVADPAAPPGPRLDPYLHVQLLEVAIDWAHVRCENGWEAWTDLRLLQSLGAGAPAVAAAIAPAAGLSLSQKLGALGGVLAAIGGFLPWYTGDGTSLDGFDLSMWWLLTAKYSTSDPSAGLLVLLAAGAVVGLARPLPYWAYTGFALVATSPPLYALTRWWTVEGPRAGLGAGVLLAAVGGALLQYVNITAIIARRAELRTTQAAMP